MSECPSQSCHDNVTRLNFFMKIVGSAIGIIVLLSVTFGTMAIKAESKQNEKINQNDKSVAVIVKSLESINEKLDKMPTREDIHKAITTRLRHNRNE